MKNLITIATTLISLVIVLSVIGTLLNKNFIFTSWWYISLLLLMVISLFVCSYKRLSYLHKVQKSSNAKILKLKTNINILVTPATNFLPKLKEKLAANRFSISEFDETFIAEKNSFGRWGSFIIHIGIIVMALGIISRVIPGWYMNQFIWIKEGESYSIPQTDYHLKNTRFILKNHENGMPSLYETDVELSDPKSESVLNYPVQVNHPLHFDHMSILQSDYQKIFSELNIKIRDKKRQISLGDILINLSSPRKEIPLQTPYVLVIDEYFPDLSLDKNNHPVSKSSFPNNPAFVFQIKDINTKHLSDKQWFILSNFTDPSLGHKSNFAIELNYFKQEYVSGLIIHKDLGKPFVYTGSFITVIGLFIALYFQHKKLWISLAHDEILIEARTNRNIEGLRLEIIQITEAINKEANNSGELASNIL